MEQWMQILIAAASVIITGLASWAVATFTTWINSKMKDKKMAQILSDIFTIITDVVMEIFQTYVEALKKTGKFDEAAQEMAKERALQKIMARLSDTMKEYIVENYGDIKVWVSEQIEVAIYQLKNK